MNTRYLLIFLLGINLASCASFQARQETMFYSKDITSKVKFIEHTEDKPMHSWLGRNVEYSSIEKIRSNLEPKLKKPLLNRGEAHITVISPVEYDHFLSKKINIKKINEIAESLKIQDLQFTPVCVGEGQINPDGKGTLHTYYVVVKSPELEQIRQKISEEFQKAGGRAADFKASYWFPHITIGFDKRDLHLEDGIYKDEKSCLYPLQVQQ